MLFDVLKTIIANNYHREIAAVSYTIFLINVNNTCVFLSFYIIFPLLSVIFVQCLLTKPSVFDEWCSNNVFQIIWVRIPFVIYRILFWITLYICWTTPCILCNLLLYFDVMYVCNSFEIYTWSLLLFDLSVWYLMIQYSVTSSL